MDPCNVCPAGSQRAEPHPTTTSTRSDTYLARLVLDCSGRQPIASLGGAWFWLQIVDNCTRMKWVMLLKSLMQVPAVFDNFLRTVVRQGTITTAGQVRCMRVQLVRMDNGPDFNNDAFRQVLRLHSITYEQSPPDASQQRGLAKRGIGVTSKIARSGLFFWAKSPLPFWGEAIKHANTHHTGNNSPNSTNPGGKSPYQMDNPDKPSQISKLRPLRCLAFTLVKTKDRQGKLNPASSCGFLAGYGVTRT